MIEKTKQYFLQNSSSGLWIMKKWYREGEEITSEVAVMRWSDGLSPEVEKAIQREAEWIVKTLNDALNKENRQE